MLPLQLLNAIMEFLQFWWEQKCLCFVFFQLWKMFPLSTTWQSLDYSKKNPDGGHLNNVTDAEQHHIINIYIIVT